MSCLVSKLDFIPGTTFRPVIYLRQGSETGSPVDLTGCTAILDFQVNGETVMLFSTAHDAGPDAGEGQITINGALGRLTFFADESVATALVDGASGNLLIDNAGDVTAYGCYVISACEC